MQNYSISGVGFATYPPQYLIDAADHFSMAVSFDLRIVKTFCIGQPVGRELSSFSPVLLEFNLGHSFLKYFFPAHN